MDQDIVDYSVANFPQCPDCLNRFPVDEEHWASQEDGAERLCLSCAEKREKQRKIRDPASLAKVLHGDVLDTGHVEHVYDQVLEEFGGVRGFAKTVKMTFDAAKPGSQAQVQLLKMVTQLAADADRARMSSRSHEQIETADLLRVIEQASGLKQGALSEEDLND